jgi:hypothetical protein
MRTANTRTIAHAIAAMLLLASCSAPQYADGREKEMLRRNATLSNQLMGLADLAGALWQEQVTRALAEGRTELQIATLARLHAGIASVTRAIAINSSPQEGLTTMYIWIKLGEHACRNRVRLMPSYFVDNCGEVFGRLNPVIDRLLSEYLDRAHIAEIDKLIASYKLEYPDSLTFGMLRIDDIAGSHAASDLVLEDSTPSMMSSVTDASRQIEMARLLGVQGVWMLARLPEALADHMDGTARMILEGTRIHEMAEHAERISERMDTVAESISTVASAQDKLSTDVAALTAAVHDASARAERAGMVALGLGLTGVGVWMGFRWRANRSARN